MKNKKRNILWSLLVLIIAGCFYGSHLERKKKRPKGIFEVFTYPYRITKWMKHNEPVSIPKLPADSASYFYGSRIQRTMSLLESSNPDKKNKVKILFYGQSIVMAMNSESIIHKLQEKYPDAIIEYENRGIGGFEAPNLVRTAVHDLYPYYPDLLIFHVYGGENGELERIIRNTKKYTTSEIMIFNHHLAFDEDSARQEKLSLNHDLSSKNIDFLAQKYGCELVDVRKEWKRYIEIHPEVEIKTLMGDRIHSDVHPNKEGNKLLELLIMRHFQNNSLSHDESNQGWYNEIQTYDVVRFIEESDDEIVLTGKYNQEKTHVVLDSGELKLTFKGNKLELNTGTKSSDNSGYIQVFIDGEKPSENDRLYSCTLPSKCLKTWFPALKRVTLGEDLEVEDWKLTITNIDYETQYLEYEVSGTKTGKDGKGNNIEKFNSNSGKLIIDPSDFFIFESDSYKKVKTPVGFEVTWKVEAMFSDTLFYNGNTKNYLIAQGLENDTHDLLLVKSDDGTGFPVKSLKVFKPKLD